MEHTFSLDTNSKPEYKKIPDVYKTFIIDIISQLYEQHSLHLMDAITQTAADAFLKIQNQSGAIEGDQNPEYQQVKESYHKVPEIQKIITENIEDIYQYFNGRQFPCNAFNDHLKAYTTIRDGDLKPMQSKSCRWNTQVANAIRTLKLENFAIKPAAQRGYLIIEAL